MLDAREAIKALMLINGGAAIAVLGFLGALAGKSDLQVKQVAFFASSFVWFAGGVALAALAFGFAYLTNLGYGSALTSRLRTWEHPFTEETKGARTWRWFRRTFHVLSVLTALAGLAAFCIGVWKVSISILQIA